MPLSGSGLDCAECRALLALLADMPDRARYEVRTLRPRERAACARAARQLAEMCEDPDVDRPAWSPDG